MTTEPAKWRLVFTDSEGLSGVAPVCDQPNEHAANAIRSAAPAHAAAVDGPEVHDCCAGPHIECWSERAAGQVLAALNAAYAEVCT